MVKNVVSVYSAALVCGLRSRYLRPLDLIIFFKVRLVSGRIAVRRFACAVCCCTLFRLFHFVRCRLSRCRSSSASFIPFHSAGTSTRDSNLLGDSVCEREGVAM
uniref:Uncharacterized protein n=1 Tax=Anopheles minimus TaxID=112268 RepID=A0A182WNV2_9DIPT